MAQKRLRDFLQSIGSFEHNIFNLGLRSPGRLRGFDSITVSTGGALVIGHTLTGIAFKNELGNTSPKNGCLMTPQGVILLEDADITGLTLDSNAGNTSIRYDLIVLNHDFGFSGPIVGTYAVIKGPLNSNVKPVPTSVTTQTIIGYVKIPAGSSNFVGCTWIKAKSPDSGDGEDARLHDFNAYSKTQNFKEIADTDISVNPAGYTTSLNDYVVIKANGNSLVYFPVSAVKIGLIAFEDVTIQAGLQLTLLINSNVKLIKRAVTTGESTQGFKGIIIADVDLSTDGVDSYLNIPAGKKAIVHLELFSDGKFYLTDYKYIDYIPLSDGIKPGMIVDVQMTSTEVNNSFDSTGLGIGAWSGYAIPNGNTYPLPGGGTKTVLDLRGRVRMTWNGLPSVGAPVYNTTLGEYTLNQLTGDKTNTLTSSNIPKHRFFLFAGGSNGGDLDANTSVLSGNLDGGNAGYVLKKSSTNATPSVGVTNYYGGDIDGNTAAFSIIQPSAALVSVIKLY